jgi:hypothetical protein
MTPKDGVIEITSRQPHDLGFAAAETVPRPTTINTEPMEVENYGPPIPGTSVAAQLSDVWNIYQAPGAFEYMWAPPTAPLTCSWTGSTTPHQSNSPRFIYESKKAQTTPRTSEQSFSRGREKTRTR